MKCRDCDRDFPPEILSEICLMDRYFLVCGICALKLRNRFHNLPPDTPFHGTGAQEMYRRAVAHLKYKETIDENTR